MVWTFKIWTQIHHSPLTEIHHWAHVNPFHQNLFAIHRLGPDDPNNKIAGNPLLRRAAGKALQDLLDAVPVNEDWGWRLTPQLLLNERETPIAMLDQRCVPNPQRSSWILFWLSWYKIAFRFDVTATVFYLYIVKLMWNIVVYWNCYHTMLLGWFSMFCNAIQLF